MRDELELLSQKSSTRKIEQKLQTIANEQEGLAGHLASCRQIGQVCTDELRTCVQQMRGEIETAKLQQTQSQTDHRMQLNE